ncbi:MAG: DUF6678 family protein [Ferruginibacter sp.]
MPRNKKYWQRRFGSLANVQPYHHHFDLRRIDDLDDEGFAFLISAVKGVNMLDLNETEISNESIRLISTLEYVKELRIKGCHKIDDGCVADLDKITSLEFLHARNTSITIDGLLKLENLSNLKTLMFSAADVEAIQEKLIQLKAMLPHCDLVIDSKPYYFNAIDLFLYAVKKNPCTYRLKIKNESLDAAWSTWLGHPSDTYIEAACQGPYSINDIEWVEINPVEKKRIGKLVPDKEFDHSEEIIRLLYRLSFPYMITDGIISAYLVTKELQ